MSTSGTRDQGIGTRFGFEIKPVHECPIPIGKRIVLVTNDGQGPSGESLCYCVRHADDLYIYEDHGDGNWKSDTSRYNSYLTIDSDCVIGWFEWDIHAQEKYKLHKEVLRLSRVVKLQKKVITELKQKIAGVSDPQSLTPSPSGPVPCSPTTDPSAPQEGGAS